MIDCCVVLYYTNKPYHQSSILFIIYKASTYADVYLTSVSNSTHTASIDTDFEDEYVQLVASEMKPYTQYVLKIGDLSTISIF